MQTSYRRQTIFEENPHLPNTPRAPTGPERIYWAQGPPGIGEQIGPGGPDRVLRTRAQAPFSASLFRIEFMVPFSGIFMTVGSFFTPILVPSCSNPADIFKPQFPHVLFIDFNTFRQPCILTNHGFNSMKRRFPQKCPSPRFRDKLGFSIHFR